MKNSIEIGKFKKELNNLEKLTKIEKQIEEIYKFKNAIRLFKTVPSSWVNNDKNLDKLTEQIMDDIRLQTKEADKIAVISLKLAEANKKYYEDNVSIITDKKYDKLFEQLKLAEKKGLVIRNSPVKNVGSMVEKLDEIVDIGITVEKLNKVKHFKKMLSLDSTKNIEGLRNFLGDEVGLLSLKIDGLTIVLTYKDGNLVSGVTRGNGEIGEDITHSVKVFKNVPTKIDFKGLLIIRGEGIIEQDVFEKLNNSLEEGEKYKNARNLCSGTVRKLNNKSVQEREVKFIAFNLINKVNIDFKDEKENELKFLEKNHFEIVKYKKVFKNTIKSEIDNFKKELELLNYGTDGLVLTINSRKKSDALGETERAPKDSIAYKWEDVKVKTKLKEVIWNCSRTGAINPIASFISVNIEGTTVNKASLHNISYLKDLKLGIGDEILVYKANKIIPQIEKNLTCSDTVEIPKQCPVCSEKTYIIEENSSKILICKNPKCLGKTINELKNFVSRDGMNIEGLGEGVLIKLLDNELIKCKGDIFTLKEKKDKFVKIDGLGEKKFTTLIDNIEKSREIDLSNFINSLSINQLGLRNSRLLARYFNNDIEKIINSKEKELLEIDGFGEKVAENITDYFLNDENKKNIEILMNEVKIKKTDSVKKNVVENITYKTFVITGSLKTYSNRKELQSEIEKLGGIVTGSISKKTTYLINNDQKSNSSKMDKAKKLGIKVITEDEFLKMKEGF